MSLIPQPGNHSDAIDPAVFSGMSSESLGLSDQVRELIEENRRLRSQLEQMRTEMSKMERVEREVMNLVKASSRERIVHDLRNVLNELVLLQAITDLK